MRKKLFNWVIARLQEQSTWRGFVWLLTAAGLQIQPDLAIQIVSAGAAVAGLIGVLSEEAK